MFNIGINEKRFLAVQASAKKAKIVTGITALGAITTLGGSIYGVISNNSGGSKLLDLARMEKDKAMEIERGRALEEFINFKNNYIAETGNLNNNLKEKIEIYNQGAKDAFKMKEQFNEKLKELLEIKGASKFAGESKPINKPIDGKRITTGECLYDENPEVQCIAYLYSKVPESWGDLKKELANNE